MDKSLDSLCLFNRYLTVDAGKAAEEVTVEHPLYGCKVCPEPYSAYKSDGRVCEYYRSLNQYRADKEKSLLAELDDVRRRLENH